MPGRRVHAFPGSLVGRVHEVPVSGSSVVLDFGCWSTDEAERRARAATRWAEAPGTTPEMTDDDHDRCRRLVTEPSAEERACAPLPDPPEAPE